MLMKIYRFVREKEVSPSTPSPKGIGNYHVFLGRERLNDWRHEERADAFVLMHITHSCRILNTFSASP